MCPDLPPLAVEHLPTLAYELKVYWPTAPLNSVFASQVEQETCLNLKHKKCWSPYAELKTSREYGFGLGQITVTASFDNFKTAKGLDSSLKNWEWENRFRADYQLRTLVLMNKVNYGKLGDVQVPVERLAMSFAAYNGGLGGVLGERKMCKAVPGCDSTRWFNNVELHSKKSRTKVAGYGKSFYEINREYVTNILFVRVKKYLPFFGEGDCDDIQ